jgi:hypothetical protein
MLNSTRRVAWPLFLVLVVWQTKCKMVRGQTEWSADKAHPAEEAEDVIDENCSPLINEFERWMALEDPSAREISFHLVRVNTKLAHKGCRPVGKPGKRYERTNGITTLHLSPQAANPSSKDAGKDLVFLACHIECNDAFGCQEASAFVFKLLTCFVKFEERTGALYVSPSPCEVR